MRREVRTAPTDARRPLSMSGPPRDTTSLLRPPATRELPARAQSAGKWSIGRGQTPLMTFLLVAVVLAPATAAAQGTIRGCIRDNHGDVLPGVEIVASNPEGREREVTDSAGCYQLRSLRAGTYSVAAALAGFVTGKRGGVAVVDGRTAESLDFALCTAAVEETDWWVPRGLNGMWKQADVVARTLTFTQENWTGERTPYAVGQDMVLFLVAGPRGFRRLAGPHSVFLLEGDEVVSDLPAEAKVLTPADLLAKLRAFAKGPECR